MCLMTESPSPEAPKKKTESTSLLAGKYSKVTHLQGQMFPSLQLETLTSTSTSTTPLHLYKYLCVPCLKYLISLIRTPFLVVAFV